VGGVGPCGETITARPAVESYRSMLVLMPRFFLEVAGIGSAIDFRRYAAGEFLHLAERFVLTHETRGCAVGFVIEWLSDQLDLEGRLVDGQQHLRSLDGCRGLRVAA